MNSFKTSNNATYRAENDRFIVTALPKTDYFVNPETDETTTNAPFVYQDVSGDFVMQAKVSHSFVSTYDACVLFAFDDEKKWAKACFEYTDLGTKAVVTVMTNGKSDDANGVNIDDNTVWLRLSRKGNIFAIHYSTDGEKFLMARLTYIPMSECIKVGIVAQSPLGDGGEMSFEHFSLLQKTVTDIRSGE